MGRAGDRPAEGGEQPSNRLDVSVIVDGDSVDDRGDGRRDAVAVRRADRRAGVETAPAIITEYIHCFLATDLSVVDGVAGDDDEDIEVVAWPLSDLDRLIATMDDAKSLIGLLRLAREARPG